jgi:hypothetical protein
MVFPIGIWTNCTPPLAPPLSPSGPFPPFGSTWVAVAPSDNRIVYFTFDLQGLWRSSDAGLTAHRVGFLDSPFMVRVDPADPDHIYVSEGVRGDNLGFYESHDGGVTCAPPSGWAAITAIIGTVDVTHFSVDPTDFRHVILSSHSPWSALGLTNNGILETTDSGATWTAHNPDASWPAGTTPCNFLYDPASGQGDRNTWLVGTDGSGMWRTTTGGTGGTPWTKVSTIAITHGGQSSYYGSDGRLYLGAANFPLVSSDNGVTLTQLTNLPNFFWYVVHGDGKNLFTAYSFTGATGLSAAPFYTSPETDGTNWSVYNSQLFLDGPLCIDYAKSTGILYAACWGTGVLALQTSNPLPPDDNVAAMFGMGMNF